MISAGARKAQKRGPRVSNCGRGRGEGRERKDGPNTAKKQKQNGGGGGGGGGTGVWLTSDMLLLGRLRIGARRLDDCLLEVVEGRPEHARLVLELWGPFVESCSRHGFPPFVSGEKKTGLAVSDGGATRIRKTKLAFVSSELPFFLFTFLSKKERSLPSFSLCFCSLPPLFFLLPFVLVLCVLPSAFVSLLEEKRRVLCVRDVRG
jgi:hypothetical protein